MPLNVALANEVKSGAAVDPAEANPTREADEPRLLKFPSKKVKCRERLGGVLKHYYRDAV